MQLPEKNDGAPVASLAPRDAGTKLKSNGDAPSSSLPKPVNPLPCPRCESLNTKFCYYNNYSVTQPRHFCRQCQRYWTAGGTLRNVPVGGGSRKKSRHQRTEPYTMQRGINHVGYPSMAQGNLMATTGTGQNIFQNVGFQHPMSTQGMAGLNFTHLPEFEQQNGHQYVGSLGDSLEASMHAMYGSGSATVALPLQMRPGAENSTPKPEETIVLDVSVPGQKNGSPPHGSSTIEEEGSTPTNGYSNSGYEEGDAVSSMWHEMHDMDNVLFQ